MARRLAAVLRAVAKASYRGARSLRAVSGNNMFYAGVTLAAMLDPPAFVFFMTMIALVLFLPSSGDPMASAPRDRLDLWPLTRAERLVLRFVSPLLNPLVWVMLAGLVWRRVTWGLWLFVAGFFAAGFAGSWRGTPLRVWWIPKISAGKWTHLLRKDLRQFATALDLYAALLLAVPAAYLRWVTHELPADAHAPLTMVALVMLSTMALTMFGLDVATGGIDRYRLLRIPGWQVLLVKGVAFLLVTLVVTAPLSISGGLAGALGLLAVGNSVPMAKSAQSRWRFRSSAPFGLSLGQMLLGLAAFGLVTQLGPVWLVACVALYAGSLWWFGRRLFG